jgi:Fic family protein
MNIEEITSDRAGYAEKTAHDYVAFFPAPLFPAVEFSAQLIEAISKADLAVGELAGIGRVLPDPNLLISASLKKEAVLSSKIEGTLTEYDDLFGFEILGNESKAPEDVKEVVNYIKAIEFAVERVDTLPMSLRLVREIHKLLMAGVRGEVATPGEFRKSQNWIGRAGSTLSNATFVPPPVEAMIEALKNWEAAHHEESSLPVIVKLAILHAQFEMIHPFIDGNGRVGRLLIVLLLTHWGILPAPILYLSAYFEKHRDGYYSGLLGVSHRGAWEEWILYFVKAIREQAVRATALCKALLELRDRYDKTIPAKQRTKTSVALLELLFKTPYIDVNTLKDHAGVGFPTAQRAIDLLVQLGILREITARKRSRVWEAKEIFALFASD